MDKKSSENILPEGESYCQATKKWLTLLAEDFAFVFKLRFVQNISI
jgi:hypothetical protein